MQTFREELRAVPSVAGQAPDVDWESVPQTPHELFMEWFRHALTQGVPEAHATTLSTVDERGAPDARMVILKDVSAVGNFKFATSDESAKAQQLLGNPNCALTLFWSPVARSIRVRGVAHRASAAESAADFRARHPLARAIALTGQQSSILTDGADRIAAITRAEAAVQNDDTLVSPLWSVWTVVPSSVEFWQGDPGRDHHRLRYVRDGAAWERQRLAC
ncbi:pyridoxine/pyridoxamine 5'-phosphate oxidase [Paeniglutamicibacter antarcticus]|uniref:Pyridoxal 5'-phosphate synthase n=1 Tax=Paeniglutamicibacter antarcticus TaxID=494023 RepID=A0ABP9TPU3_9MICC